MEQVIMIKDRFGKKITKVDFESELIVDEMFLIPKKGLAESLEREFADEQVDSVSVVELAEFTISDTSLVATTDETFGPVIPESIEVEEGDVILRFMWVTFGNETEALIRFVTGEFTNLPAGIGYENGYFIRTNK
ncbi:MAG: hypothetical protein ACRC37_02150 [Lentisphaeria bacterium]